MIIINKTKDFGINKEHKCAVAIGKFDGIHVGHRKLLDQIIAAKKDGYKATVFTFDPTPEELFLGKILPAIDTKEEKRRKFEALGIDYLIEYPLTFQSASISPYDFMEEILNKELHSALIVSGKDLSFGDKGLGNAKMLLDYANLHGMEYRIIDKVCVDGVEVSSTKIRELVAKGKMENAASMLGTPYSISGQIIHGRHIGHSLNMPTVNVMIENGKLIPPKGVYVSKSVVNGVEYRGISNIGNKPTVSDHEMLGIETYFYDFEGDLYGEQVVTKLLKFERPEQKFDSLDSLKKQLEKDKKYGQEYFTQE